MEIQEIQKRIMNFVDKRTKANNFELTPEQSYIHLTEEMGEVARQLSNKKMRPEKFDENNLREEIIDVLLETIILASSCNVDLNKEINNKIEVLFKKHGFSEK